MQHGRQSAPVASVCERRACQSASSRRYIRALQARRSQERRVARVAALEIGRDAARKNKSELNTIKVRTKVKLIVLHLNSLSIAALAAISSLFGQIGIAAGATVAHKAMLVVIGGVLTFGSSSRALLGQGVGGMVAQ